MRIRFYYYFPDVLVSYMYMYNTQIYVCRVKVSGYDVIYLVELYSLMVDVCAGVQCPLLCKEFIVDAYQVLKARVAGADAILLIASVLPNADLSYFIKVAKSMGMVCLIEVHTEGELRRILQVPGIESQILGINNRDLGTFKVGALSGYS